MWMLLDPYCGTGTSLVEASMFGMNGAGCDINPLVRLIATAKTTPISPQVLERYSQDLMDVIFQGAFSVFGSTIQRPIKKSP